MKLADLLAQQKCTSKCTAKQLQRGEYARTLLKAKIINGTPYGLAGYINSILLNAGGVSTVCTETTPTHGNALSTVKYKYI